MGSVNNFNFYVKGKKFVLSLLSSFFVLCNRVKSSKIIVISSCSEQNIFILVYKIFQLISELLSRLIDRLFPYLLNNNIRETCIEGYKSSDDEEFRIFKVKLA